jgi:hypothetical protein
MGIMANTSQKILPEFQEFLLERKLAHEKHIPFLAYWVSRFLHVLLPYGPPPITAIPAAKSSASPENSRSIIP